MQLARITKISYWYENTRLVGWKDKVTTAARCTKCTTGGSLQSTQPEEVSKPNIGALYWVYALGVKWLGFGGVDRCKGGA